jgi:hypothetical protein
MTARRLRIRQIRRTVVAAAVTVFIALFATVYIQMASGNDPALGASVTPAAITETATTTSEPVTTAQS